MASLIPGFRGLRLLETRGGNHFTANKQTLRRSISKDVPVRRSTTAPCALGPKQSQDDDSSPAKGSRSRTPVVSVGNGPAPVPAPPPETPPGLANYISDGFQDEQQESLARYFSSVVKVECIHTEPNFSLPWQRQRQFSSTSSGFAVARGEKRWILTNAHSCEYYSQVKVRKSGDDQKYLATVLAIGTECDIALLTIEDESFWEGITPLHLGALPRLQDNVWVVGYPVGGDTISVTAGVVSRIEVTDYVHGRMDLLGIQIDAAINSGNSGGPVFNENGECAGIAFQSYAGTEFAENIGYVIPTPVISHFLEDYERHGTFTGFPIIGISWQKMENEALRSALKMGPQHKGILVRSVAPTAAAAAVLKADDVIMKFEGVAVACDATVPFRPGERIAFPFLVSSKFVGETAQLSILRDGQEMEVEVELSKPSLLVPRHISNRNPSYAIVGGLVFTTLTEPYLESEYGAEYFNASPVDHLAALYHGRPKKAGEEVIMLSQVLACDATVGYESLFNHRVLKLNGVELNTLAELVAGVARCTDEYLRFDLQHDSVVILKREAALAATTDVLAAHAIAEPMSGDLTPYVAAAATASQTPGVP